VSGDATVGIIANPMAGRDVRRLVARATNLTPETKRDQVARAAIGAAAAGASRILVCAEPFRISSSAVENLDVGAEIEVLDVGAKLDAGDSARAALAMREAGSAALVVLGGDGTNRAIAKTCPELPLVPISTGTNNVFPTPLEATLAGGAAGLIASGRIHRDEVAQRSKIVRVQIDGGVDGGGEDLALVDVVKLVGDRVGSLLPFDPDKIREVALARAEPAAIGISPIGGLLCPCGADDSFGVAVSCLASGDHGNSEGVRSLLVPISPGLYRTVQIASFRRLELGESIRWMGPGVLALDGDREYTLQADQASSLRVVREGPWVVDVGRALVLAAERGLYLDRGPWRDALDTAGSAPDCC
jgi:hypothetical protein